MRSERYILTYVIIILSVLLLITGFGYINYRNTSFNGLSRKTTYTVGKRIKYAGLNWYVVSDDGKHVTLILANNAKIGPYGDTNSWKDSEVREYLNDEWIKYTEQTTLKDEIDHGALVLDTEAINYIRLIRYDEIKDSPIKNESNSPYWTMSGFNDKVWYALENGSLEYTTYDTETSSTGICYKGNGATNLNDITKKNQIINIKTKDTINEPYELNAIVSMEIESVADDCQKDYKLENGLYSAYGESTTYTSGWKQEEKKESLGIRPVITVKKK